jgi:hypothetical protein
MMLDGHYRWASLITRLWNGISRGFHWFAGSFSFCEARAFRKLGGFNNELFVSEEIDLSKRLKKLARTEGRKLVILHRHPLVTSGRKAHLYTPGEHLRFLARILLGGRRTFTDRAACHTWYDGRR